MAPPNVDGAIAFKRFSLSYLKEITAARKPLAGQ
jgi:hypothetical protein